MVVGLVGAGGISLLLLLKMIRGSKRVQDSATVVDQNDTFTFEILDSNNFAEAADLWSDVNSKQDILATHLRLVKADAKEAFQNGFADLQYQGLSVLARDKQTSKLAGYRLSRDFTTNNTLKGKLEHWFFRCLDRQNWLALSIAPSALLRSAPIPGMIMAVTDRWAEGQDKELVKSPGKVLQMFSIGVREGYTRKGLALQMNEISHRIARQKGFKKAVVCCAHSISTHLFEKAGYKQCFVQSYDDFTWGGKHPFAGIKDMSGTKREPHCTVLEYTF